MGEPYAPDTFQPRHPAVLIPNTEEDFDFGRVLDHALAQNSPPGTGEPGQTTQYLYDEGMRAWLGRIFRLNGKSIPVVMAPPMNAFSEYRRVCCSDLPKDSNLPLPFVSVSCAPPAVRGGSNPFPVRHMAFVDDEIARRATAKYGVSYARYPKPITLTYTVTVWAQLKQHLHWLAQRLDETFWDHLAYFLVATPYTNRFLAPVRRTGINDASSMERGTEERILRWDYTLEVEAWSFFDTLRAPTVHRATEEIQAKGPGEPDSALETVFYKSEDLTGAAKPPLDQLPPPKEPVTDGVTQ